LIPPFLDCDLARVPGKISGRKLKFLDVLGPDILLALRKRAEMPGLCHWYNLR
jgi:hypothetical protein